MSTSNNVTTKTMADGTRQPAIEEAINTAPPPPYTDADSDISPEDYNMFHNMAERPHKLTINADTKVHGSGNLVPINNTSILADASKFSALLLKAIAQLNAAASANADADGVTPRLCVDLTINCGVSVVGSRNVVGNIGIKRKATVPAAGAEVMVLGKDEAVGGAKREADDEEVSSPLDPDLCHLRGRILTMTRLGHRRRTATSETHRCW
jgi:hypothetical protein